MRCARRRWMLAVALLADGGHESAVAASALLAYGGQGSAAAAPARLEAAAIVQAADAHRGLRAPYRFVARIDSLGASTSAKPRVGATPRTATVVDVHSADLSRQLIFVREPTRGDVMLKAGNTVWLRPRRLHRLTRIPPELRLFGGVAIADVVAVDLTGMYSARFRTAACTPEGDYVLDLEAREAQVRYARATYRVACETLAPRRLELLAASGLTLKSVSYEALVPVLGQRIATRLVVEDHVFGDVSTIAMSQFAWLERVDDTMFTPDYLLSVPVLSGD